MDCNIKLVLCLTFITAVHSYNCKTAADGAYEISCQSYTKCVNGTATTVECHPPEVVNAETGLCDRALNVKTPCGTFRDCSYRDDGNYPDLETNCNWYHTCAYGIFYGHHRCSNGLVLNSILQICDFPYNVPPPCGTKTT